jgi:uncharacterized membrane protein (DUF485 family)
MNEDTSGLDPQRALGLSQAATDRAQAFYSDSGRLVTAVWGLAWLIGYGTLWWATPEVTGSTPGWAFAVGGGALAVAIVLSAIAGVRAGGELVGPSAKAAAFYGWSWFVAFGAGMSATGMIADQYQLSDELTGVLFNVMAAALTGTLYMSGAAVFKEPAMFVVGAVMIALAPLGVGVGVPGGYLAMALIGGGLMLISFVFQTIQGRRLRAGGRGRRTEAAAQ